MTKKETDKNNRPKEHTIPLKAIDEMPDFANDSMEKIETWIKAVLPEELQEVVLSKIKEERSK